MMGEALLLYSSAPSGTYEVFLRTAYTCLVVHENDSIFNTCISNRKHGHVSISLYKQIK